MSLWDVLTLFLQYAGMSHALRSVPLIISLYEISGYRDLDRHLMYLFSVVFYCYTLLIKIVWMFKVAFSHWHFYALIGVCLFNQVGIRW